MKACKTLFLPILACVLVASCSGEDSNQERNEQSASGMPINAGLASVDYMGPARATLSEKTFIGVDGEAVPPSSLDGKNVLVNFWATWCAPCIRELPSLINASEELGDDFVVLLASDESLEQISGFLAENDFAPQHFVRLDGSFAIHGINAVPSTNLYNPQGIDIGNWLGAFEWDSAEVLAQLREVAASKQDAAE